MKVTGAIAFVLATSASLVGAMPTHNVVRDSVQSRTYNLTARTTNTTLPPPPGGFPGFGPPGGLSGRSEPHAFKPQRRDSSKQARSFTNGIGGDRPGFNGTSPPAPGFPIPPPGASLST